MLPLLLVNFLIDVYLYYVIVRNYKREIQKNKDKIAL